MVRRRKARPVTARAPRAAQGAALRPPAKLEAYTFEVARDEYAIFTFPIPEIEPLPELSAAEREIVHALVEGQSNKEIAERRGTSHHTVANQLRSIYVKLGVSGRVELIRRCTRSVS
jgi:DNA-binding CsgD family transcriptional regulator